MHSAAKLAMPDVEADNACTHLTVTFRGQAPDEDVLYFVRRCAQGLGEADGPLEVTIERRRDWHQVNVDLWGRSPTRNICECDTDVFLAVRNAFGRIACVPRTSG